jgi:hypothetical protein
MRADIIKLGKQKWRSHWLSDLCFLVITAATWVGMIWLLWPRLVTTGLGLVSRQMATLAALDDLIAGVGRRVAHWY